MNNVQFRALELLTSTVNNLLALDPSPKPDISAVIKTAIELIDDLSDIDTVAAIAEDHAQSSRRKASAFAAMYKGLSEDNDSNNGR